MAAAAGVAVGRISEVINVGGGRRPESQPSPVPSVATRISAGSVGAGRDQDDLDELDNLTSARDKLMLYNMLALEKDISIERGCPRDSAIGRTYPARWLSTQVDVACLEIDAEHLNTRQHALGGLINTALMLRKAISKINHGADSPRLVSTTHTQPVSTQGRHSTGTSSRKQSSIRGSTGSAHGSHPVEGSMLRAHIQELVAVQLEPHLKIITSAMPQCISIRQVIADGLASQWSWSERVELLLQISYGVTSLHSQGVIHGNLRLSNIYINPDVKRIVICGAGWDRLLPYDILNIHQADDPGSIRWTAPDCYAYISNIGGRRRSTNTPQPSTVTTMSTARPASNLSPAQQRRQRPHPHAHRPACDVFAFAVTMWELADSTGALPYSNLRYSREVMSFVQENNRMLIPASWPTDFRELITLCWSSDFSRRPSFSAISEALETLLHEQKTIPRRNSDLTTSQDSFVSSADSFTG